MNNSSFIRETNDKDFDRAEHKIKIIKTIILTIIIITIVAGLALIIFNFSDYMDYLDSAEVGYSAGMQFYSSRYSACIYGQCALICGIAAIIPYLILSAFANAIITILYGVKDSIHIAERNADAIKVLKDNIQ